MFYDFINEKYDYQIIEEIKQNDMQYWQCMCL